MANSRGPSSMRNMMYNAKHSLLPPKIPFPSISPSYPDYVPSSAVGPKVIPKPREGNLHHHRTSSESFLIEEQPSWLDELLNEPETPVVRGGHRRSSSDSFAYIDMVDSARDNFKLKNLMSVPSWGSQDLEHYKDAWQTSFYAESKSLGKHKNQAWDSSLKSVVRPISLHSVVDNITLQSSGSLSAPQDLERVQTITAESQDPIASGHHDEKGSCEKKDIFYGKIYASETDTKRAKQQFAQRSRVRKLQYIAELERNVQSLQAEGSEVSAELEFLNQQNLILSMENQALKQRLESLAQEQLIKYFEHEVLEREIGRLRALYQQQQQPQQQLQQKQPSSSHRHSNSRDLESQFANLSLKHKDATNPGHDPVSGQLHI